MLLEGTANRRNTSGYIYRLFYSKQEKTGLHKSAGKNTNCHSNCCCSAQKKKEKMITYE